MQKGETFVKNLISYIVKSYIGLWMFWWGCIVKGVTNVRSKNGREQRQKKSKDRK